MAFQNGKVLRVVLAARAGPILEVNTFHYDLHDDTTTGGANDPQTLADLFRDVVRPPFAALFGAGYSIDPIHVEEAIDPLDPHRPRASWTSGAAVPGTRLPTTDELPPAMCVVVRTVSDSLGRRYNGRMFVSGESHEGDQASGQWTTAWINTVNAFVNAIPKEPDIATGPSQSSAHWSVYSRTARAQSAPLYLAHIKSTITRTNVHWLRSRQL